MQMNTMLTLLVLTATALSCFGQTMTATTVNATTLNWQQPAFDPQQISGLAYYFDYRDLATNVAISSWTDKVSATVWSQTSAALKPTNSASGLRWNSSLESGPQINGNLTNLTGISLTQPYSIWFAFSVGVNLNSSYLCLMTELASGGFYIKAWEAGGRSLNVYRAGLNTASAKFGEASGGTLPLMSWLVANGNSYTNAALWGSTSGGSFTLKTIGSDTVGDENGPYIKFIGIWPGVTLTATDASNLWYFATQH
jgi:hypothetical protein